MQYEDLDSDTIAIIECMCQHTGWTRQKAILCLVELGMGVMIASMHSTKRPFLRISSSGIHKGFSDQDVAVWKLNDVIFKNPDLQRVAIAYFNAWHIPLQSIV